MRRLILMLFAFCLAPVAASAAPLVTADWLVENAERPDLVILDLRSRLNGGSRAAFEKDHIAGAVYSDYLRAGWRVTRDGVPGQLPPAADLEVLIGGLGIGNDSHVVLVAGGRNALGMASATRVYWTFKMLGHDRVSILDGGYRAYLADPGRPFRKRLASTTGESLQGQFPARPAGRAGRCNERPAARRRIGRQPAAALLPRQGQEPGGGAGWHSSRCGERPRVPAGGQRWLFRLRRSGGRPDAPGEPERRGRTDQLLQHRALGFPWDGSSRAKSSATSRPGSMTAPWPIGRRIPPGRSKSLKARPTRCSETHWAVPRRRGLGIFPGQTGGCWSWRDCCCLGGTAAIGGAEGGRQGALYLLGAALGLVLYHAAFGFASSWRAFVADGEGRGLRAQMLMLALATVFFLPLLEQGSFWGRPVSGAFAPLGLTVAAGACLFGIGMQLGGACASGTLYSLGGGSVRMVVTLVFFMAGSVIGTLHLPWWLSVSQRDTISLTAELGLYGALALQLGIFATVAAATLLLERVRRPVRIAQPTPQDFLHRLYQGPWPLLAGAVALALLNVATLGIAGHPWTVSFGYTLWGRENRGSRRPRYRCLAILDLELSQPCAGRLGLCQHHVGNEFRHSGRRLPGGLSCRALPARLAPALAAPAGGGARRPLDGLRRKARFRLQCRGLFQRGSIRLASWLAMVCTAPWPAPLPAMRCARSSGSLPGLTQSPPPRLDRNSLPPQCEQSFTLRCWNQHEQ